jgi:hypothetical protein
MNDVLVNADPDNNVGCPNCGCGGDTCGADGCVCYGQNCYNINVKDSTPSGMTDQFGMWFQWSYSPLTVQELAVEPILETSATLAGKDLRATFIVSIPEYVEGEPVPIGDAWVEFLGKDGSVIQFYGIFIDPSKMQLHGFSELGWEVILEDPEVLWPAQAGMSWKFVALGRGNESVVTELTGTLEAS